jgi:YidC/Oxa1 family membrane protein insertase
MFVVANILQPLIDVADAVLNFFHDDVGFGWGASIVGLTFVTRLVILPLSLKQIRSMRALQAYQPQIKEIQEKYKDDRQRLQRELMELYQREKINPFASCIPLILQIPVFLALFYLLQGDDFKAEVTGCSQASESFDACVEETAVPFLFIDTIVENAVGLELIALIVLFVVTQLGAGLVMMSSADRNQRILMFALPLIIVPFIISFPAGLVVYWIATNVWTLGQQFLVKRIIPPPEKATPEAIEQTKAAKPPPPPPRKKKKRR